MKYKTRYSVPSCNVAEMFNDSESPVRFALNKASEYLDDRIGSISEPTNAFEGIVDIPGILLTPLVFTYYLITASSLYKRLEPNNS